jgi:hypothetical protein
VQQEVLVTMLKRVGAIGAVAGLAALGAAAMSTLAHAWWRGGVGIGVWGSAGGRCTTGLRAAAGLRTTASALPVAAAPRLGAPALGARLLGAGPPGLRPARTARRMRAASRMMTA